MDYSAQEYTDMIYCYGMARGNSRAAERIYAELFPNRERHPSRDTIRQCFRRARETGILLVQRQNHEVPVRRHVNVDEEVLHAFEVNPQNSIRRVARALGIPQTTVHCILRENGLHPYHFQRVQQLLARDEMPRIFFCEGILIFCFNFYSIIMKCAYSIQYN